MEKIEWMSGEKEHEWAVAKKMLEINGELMPNGTKLRRKDSNLNHSFMVIDNKIIAVSGKGLYLGRGLEGVVKLAEDEAGHLIALKMIKKPSRESNPDTEADIASDLGVAGDKITRLSKNTNLKHYIAYQFLGETDLFHYLAKNRLSLDQCYELSINLSLALHRLHTGLDSKTNTSYVHGDLHAGNILVNDQGQPTLIDYGRSTSSNFRYSELIKLRDLFYIPINNRRIEDKYKKRIFDNWMGEYHFQYELPEFSKRLNKRPLQKNTIYLYLKPEDKDNDGIFHRAHYAVLDSKDTLKEGIINLNQLAIKPVTDIDEWEMTIALSSTEYSIVKEATLNMASQSNHIVDKKKVNPALYDFFNQEPDDALSMALSLTLCRFDLDTYEQKFKANKNHKPYESILKLNSIKDDIFSLYKNLTVLSDASNPLIKETKDCLVDLILNCADKNQLSSVINHINTIQVNQAANKGAILDDIQRIRFKLTGHHDLNVITDPSRLISSTQKFKQIKSQIAQIKKPDSLEPIEDLKITLDPPSNER